MLSVCVPTPFDVIHMRARTHFMCTHTIYISEIGNNDYHLYSDVFVSCAFVYAENVRILQLCISHAVPHKHLMNIQLLTFFGCTLSGYLACERIIWRPFHSAGQQYQICIRINLPHIIPGEQWWVLRMKLVFLFWLSDLYVRLFVRA